MNLLIRTGWLILLAVATLGVNPLKADDNIPQVGQMAPSFSLPSQDGSVVSLKDFRGKYVVLYFYPKDGTPGCTLEAHNFQKDLPKYEADNAVIVGVSVDSLDSHKSFCANQGLTFKVLSDPDKKVVQQYGCLRDMMGFKIAARTTFLVAPDGKIVKEWKGVTPSNHSQEVLEALGSMKK